LLPQVPILDRMETIGAPELLIILFVVLLFIGPSKLPKMARSLAEAVREFRHHHEPETDSETR